MKKILFLTFDHPARRDDSHSGKRVDAVFMPWLYPVFLIFSTSTHNGPEKNPGRTAM